MGQGENDSADNLLAPSDNSNKLEDLRVKERCIEQREALPGEPRCVICGRYGEYVCDQTDDDICSVECKTTLLARLAAKTKPAVKAAKRVNLPFSDESFCVRDNNFPEIPSLHTGQIASLRSKLDICVKGDAVPDPIMCFSSCGLPEKLVHNLETAGYIMPTPVQMQAIPASISNRSLLVSADTGSGKTVSFLVPIIAHCSQVRSQQCTSKRGPLAIVLAPTRELCLQVEEQAKVLGKGLPFKTALVVGGDPLAQQIYRIENYGVALWSLATFLSPWAAARSLWLFLSTRVLLGIAEGVALPSMNNLVLRWFPHTERSSAVGIAMASFQLGNTIGLLLSHIIMSRAGIFGPFVIFGLFGFLWVLVWISAISGTPGEHTQISAYELEYITKGQKLVKPQIGCEKLRKVPPFSKLLSKWPTWALISANAMHSWGYFVILSWMPVYFKTIYHVNLREAAWFCALPWAMMVVLGYVAGVVSVMFIRNGIELIVGTPGRLIDLLMKHNVDLNDVSVFVLDEVDCLLERGIRDQVMQIFRALSHPQVLMFPATVHSEVEKMSNSLVNNVIHISCGNPTRQNKSVKEVVIWVESKQKKQKIFEIMTSKHHFKEQHLMWDPDGYTVQFANKSHSQLASSLALLLEASLATSSALLSNIKEASRCRQDNHKRGPYSDRDDGDRPLLHVKPRKGPQTPMDETLKSDSGTRMSFPPVIAQNVQSQNADGIAKKSTTRELAIENRDSTANVNDSISLVASYPAPNARLGENVINKGSGSSDKTPVNATSSFQFFVIADEGLDLFVDLNATPIMELMIAARKAVPELQLEYGIAVDKVYTGTFMSSLDMAGFSISIMRSDENILQRLGIIFVPSQLFPVEFSAMPTYQEINALSINVEEKMQTEDTSTKEMTAVHNIDNVEEKKTTDLIPRWCSTLESGASLAKASTLLASWNGNCRGILTAFDAGNRLGDKPNFNGGGMSWTVG